MLLTRPRRVAGTAYAPPDWSEVLTQMLAPLLVRTFITTSGMEAIRLAERHGMHMAVLDANLAAQEQSGMDAMTVVRLLHQRRRAAAGDFRRSPVGTAGWDGPYDAGYQEPPGAVREEGRRIKVQGPQTPADAGHQERRTVAPLIILLAPQREERWLREALRWDVFSVLPEPLDINELLAVMARGLERFFGNRWPEAGF